MELTVFLTWLVAQGGAPVVANLAMSKIPALANLAPEPKRYVTFAITGVVAAGAYLGQVAMGYQPLPAGTKGWIEAIFYAGAGAIAMITGQVIHARTDLAKKA